MKSVEMIPLLRRTRVSGRDTAKMRPTMHGPCPRKRGVAFALPLDLPRSARHTLDGATVQRRPSGRESICRVRGEQPGRLEPKPLANHGRSGGLHLRQRDRLQRRWRAHQQPVRESRTIGWAYVVPRNISLDRVFIFDASARRPGRPSIEINLTRILLHCFLRCFRTAVPTAELSGHHQRRSVGRSGGNNKASFDQELSFLGGATTAPLR